MSRLEPRHSLLGYSTPNVGDLLERASEPARKALEAAALLARWRIEATRRIEATDAELRSEPWPTRPSKQPVTDDVESPDLLRALLALHPGEVTRVLLGGAAPNFQAVCGRWKAVVDDESAKGPARLPLEPRWGRRWALAAVRGVEAIDINVLIASLENRTLEALMPLSAAVGSGQSTIGEATGFALSTLQASGVGRFEDVTPAYLNRHNGLEQLEAALSNTPGAILVGKPRSGRRTLARAWGEQVREGKTALEGYRPWVDPLNTVYEGNEADWETLAAKRVVMMLNSVCEDPHARYVAERFSSWAANGAHIRVLLVSTEEGLDELYQAVPSTRDFAEVRVPAIDDLDRLPIWMCHAIDDPRLGLDHAVGAITDLDPAEVRRIDPWDFASLLGGKQAIAYQLPRSAHHATGWVARYVSGQVSDHYLESLRGRFVKSFIGSPERLGMLRELDRKLREGKTPAFRSPGAPASTARR